MKTKIFLIIMIILFAVSCAKNNPSNPIHSNGEIREKTDLGNVETPTDNGGNSGNTGNTDNNNPTDNGGNSGNTGNTDNNNPTDNGGNSGNTGNTDNKNPTDNGGSSDNNGDNTEEKPILPPLDDYLHMYVGTAKYYVKTLDDAVVTPHSDENIYVEIYTDYIVVSSGATFFFENIKRPSNEEYQSTEYYNGATYNLNLKINADGTARLRLSIRDTEYSYHFDADKLPEFIKN